MKPAITLNNEPIPEQEYQVDIEELVQDTLDQFKTIRNNEYIDENGIDQATD